MVGMHFLFFFFFLFSAIFQLQSAPVLAWTSAFIWQKTHFWWNSKFSSHGIKLLIFFHSQTCIDKREEENDVISDIAVISFSQFWIPLVDLSSEKPSSASRLKSNIFTECRAGKDFPSRFSSTQRQSPIQILEWFFDVLEYSYEVQGILSDNRESPWLISSFTGVSLLN